MKKITLLFLFTLLTLTAQAQIVAWSSDSEDLTDWGILDNDGDGNNWGIYTELEDIGFATGNVLGSASWSSTGALTPDNILFTPTFDIPITALSISYKMKVAATFTPDFAEHYAVYVYDDALGATIDNVIFEETLTAGGNGTAKDITASIPASFAGKTIGILIRHYNCTNQDVLAIDDFEVSYSNSLSVVDNTLPITSVYPNPVKDIVTVDTNAVIDSVTLVNHLGQTVMDIKSDKISNNSIDLSEIKGGLYFMNLKSEGRSSTVKIIKQ